MSSVKSAATPRAIVEDLWGRQMTREIWTGNFEKVLPISNQVFDLTAILPAVFYMFRFGQRRGKGKFVETFGLTTGTMKEQRKSATIERVAGKLDENGRFEEFAGETEQPSLGTFFSVFVWRTLGMLWVGRSGSACGPGPLHGELDRSPK